MDEDGNVIPTTIPPQDCGESGNCFDGFGDVSGDYDDDVSQGTIQRDSIQGWARVVRIFHTSSGRSGKQQEEQNSPNLGTTFLAGPCFIQSISYPNADEVVEGVQSPGDFLDVIYVCMAPTVYSLLFVRICRHRMTET